MRNDIDVETQESTSVSVQAVGKRQKKALQKLGEQAAQGSTMTHKVMGQEVLFKLVEVPADKIEKKTMVFWGNERVQELLDAHAVSDLTPTFKDQGQQVPAFGRDICGRIEVADGSRRRFTAMETKQAFYVWVGVLDDKQMQFLSEIGNQYKETSAWEKGIGYARLLKSATQEEVSEMVKVSRKAMMRCVNTAQLPQEFIQSFTSPNELSARKGEALYKMYRDLEEKKQQEIVNFCFNFLIPEKGQHSTDQIIELFVEKCGVAENKPEPEKPRELAMGATVAAKNGKATINIPNISDETLKRIEEFIDKTLSEEALKNC
ncbi:ParB/RepB/Spo0J family partition protein [Vibrio owensii]|uniref:ParB/RepB/Spo0J family partition protein n=1 Tax=Vibrio owensii TaxID=696485 RepID=UPI00104DCA3C|nr:ParB/RepB/Spo0J family partition protein [Vibrio owensii]TDE19303.1 ParB/RepB/Spo0J family partition protein [Vibrio owensii]